MSEIKMYGSDELVRRVMMNLARSYHSNVDKPRWAVVSQVFALGSGYSEELCRIYNQDPNEIIKGIIWNDSRESDG